mgnify:CR=1 FL=1
MGQPTLFKNLIAAINTTSTGTATTLLTHSCSLKQPDGAAGNGGILDRLIVYNSDTQLHVVDIFKVGATLSVGSSNLIESVSIGSRQQPYIFEGPIYGACGDFYAFRLQEAASSCGGVYMTAHYHEMS